MLDEARRGVAMPWSFVIDERLDGRSEG